MSLHKRTFDWPAFKGDDLAIAWARRDLTSIDQVLTVVKGRTACVQAGANLGVFPKFLSQFFGAVYTFEPSPALFPDFCANAPEPNIVRLQAALGEHPQLVGTSNVRRDAKKLPDHDGLTHVVPDGIVPTLRLDDFALPVVDLLYLDLEGYELHALRGAIDTIRRCRPVIAVEINSNIRFEGATEQDVRTFVLEQGYAPAFRVRSDDVFVPREIA